MIFKYKKTKNEPSQMQKYNKIWDRIVPVEEGKES